MSSEYHEGPCCSGCIGEQNEGYPGGGEFCCCHDGKTALENRDYTPKYPPINGIPPKEFRYFEENTKKRWVQRFKAELSEKIRIDYYSNAGTGESLKTMVRLTNTENGEVWY